MPKPAEPDCAAAVPLAMRTGDAPARKRNTPLEIPLAAD
jgi:hypothetical protein